MEVTVNYVNEEDYRLTQFPIAKGEDLTNDYPQDEIPVLLGAGLGRYPIGSLIEIADPATQRMQSLRVVGLLKKNAFHPNIYYPNSKEYLNFAIILPINGSLYPKFWSKFTS